MKKFILTLVILLALSSCSEASKRDLKSFKSNFSGGLNRTVEVYSNTGELLKTYSGRFDIEEGSDGKVMFDVDNKRVIIKNALVVIEEKE